jgi:hypothetical protein
MRHEPRSRWSRVRVCRVSGVPVPPSQLSSGRLFVTCYLVGAGAGHQRGVYTPEGSPTRGPSLHQHHTQNVKTRPPHQHFRVKTAAAASNMALELAPVPCLPSTMRHTPMYCYLLRLSAGGSAEQARRGAPEGLAPGCCAALINAGLRLRRPARRRRRRGARPPSSGSPRPRTRRAT